MVVDRGAAVPHIKCLFVTRTHVCVWFVCQAGVCDLAKSTRSVEMCIVKQPPHQAPVGMGECLDTCRLVGARSRSLGLDLANR
jgi:hypothetical protein